MPLHVRAVGQAQSGREAEEEGVWERRRGRGECCAAAAGTVAPGYPFFHSDCTTAVQKTNQKTVKSNQSINFYCLSLGFEANEFLKQEKCSQKCLSVVHKQQHGPSRTKRQHTPRED
jgi:hypothetical protein